MEKEKANPSTTTNTITPESRKYSRQPVPKVLSSGSRSNHRGRPSSVHADLLLSRELDELRHLSIGSPVPTPGSSEVDDPLTPSSCCVPAGEKEGDEKGTGIEQPPGASGFPVIKVDGCGSLPVPVMTTGSGDGGGGAAMRQNKNARRNSDTLATPCHVPRSSGSRVVRYKSFGGSEENAVSD